MSKIKIIIVLVIAVAFIYLWVCVTDFLFTVSGGKPFFCIRDKENNYYGLGYSYFVYDHPITGKSEYAFYIMGNLVHSTFTN